MKFIKGLLKVIASGIVAVAIICGLLCFYDIKPIHKENPKGNTDFVWLPNSIWVKATEGIAFGKFDANGFNNKSVISNPDIIVLGSSHMEAFNVMQNENSAYLLSQKLNGIKRKVKRPHQRLYLSVRSFLILVLLEMDVSIKTFYYSGGTL